jgi:hypothetical protein
MDDGLRRRGETVTNLRDAVRRARLADAERGASLADLRAAELVRLEILRDALAPLFAEIPDDADLFDHGLVPGEHPRLFVDILAFIEMGEDKRHYRFVQDSRWGQRVILETDDIQAMIRAVTDYVALRLVERRKALASDLAPPPPARSALPPTTPAQPKPLAEPPPEPRAEVQLAQPSPPPPRTGLPPALIFALGVAAGIFATLFVGLMRARDLLPF